MIYLGDTKIGKMYLGSTSIGKAYLGDTLVFNSGSTPPTPSILPEGYTQLSYIEQTRGNSAYIKTGVMTSNTIGFSIDAISYDTISGNANQYGCFFGGRTGSAQNDLQLTTYSANLSIQPGGSLRTGSLTYNAFLANSTRFTASLSGNSYSANGSTNNNIQRNVSTGREIYLFALNNNGTAAQYGHFRLYSFVITDNGSEVRHFYPCTNPSNVVGLYDTIGEAFYTSENSTAFLGG